MAGDRNVVIRLRGEIADFQAKMVAAGKSIGSVADKATSAEKESQKFRKGLDQLGSTAGRIGLVAGAGIAAAVTAAANFDQAMSNVRAATHETADNMDALREAAIQAGADTAFSASEAAAGIENLAKAGVQTKDILGGGLQGALDLAAAGTIDVGTAAETAATAMTQFGLSGEQVPHIADLLAAAAGKAQGEVTDMAYALKQSGLVADQVGLSIEETTGGLAAFASAGLLGSDAGTSFKTMLSALTPNTEKAASAMEQYGVNAYDAQGNFVGLTALAGQLRNGLSDLTDEQRQATLETIFGSDAVRAASVLYEQGSKGISTWISAVDDSGYAAETAAIKLDNLKGDLEAFKGSLETALIGVGEGSQGPLRSLVQGATDAVNAFNGLPGPVKDVTSAFLAVTAVTGGGVWFGSKAIGAVANMRTAMVDLGFAADGAKLSMAGVAQSAGLLAGLTFTGIGTLDMMDSASRSREAAEATAASFEDLSNVLADSNVGKYATDLGIDLDRLAADLATYGQRGEYVAEIQKKLDESGHGLGPMFKAMGGTIIPGYTNATEKASDALSDFNNIVQNQQRVMAAGAGAGEAILSPFTRLGDVLTTVNDASAAATDGIGALGIETSEAARAVLELDDAMTALFVKFDVDAATDAWTASLKGLRKELDGGAGALDRNTEQGRKNRASIREQFLDLKAMAEAQFDVTGDTKQLTKTMLDGREAIIKQAEAAGIGRDAMEKYLRALGMTPKEIRTTIRLMDAPKAGNQLDDLIYKARILKGELAAMSKTRIDIRSRGTGALNGYAMGGYTGDVPVHAVAGVVHGREFVVNAQATAQNRALLEAINRGVPGYRNGGYVAAQSSTTNYYGAGTEIDYDRLAAAMSKARPLYGPVHVRDGSDFLRTLEQDQRREAIGGANFRG